jgi:hypothetical protein
MKTRKRNGEHVVPDRSKHTKQRATPDPGAQERAAVLGTIPDQATHWGCRKRADHPERLDPHKRWAWCDWQVGEGIAGAEFPIDTLNADEIRRRWGPGTYRVMYLVLAAGNKKVVGQGPSFTLLPLRRELVRREGPGEVSASAHAAAGPRAVPPAAPGAAPGGGGDLATAVALFQFLQGQSDAIAQRTVERERVFFQSQIEMMREHFERLNRGHPSEQSIQALRDEIAELADVGPEGDGGPNLAETINSVTAQVLPLASRALDLLAASKKPPTP